MIAVLAAALVAITIVVVINFLLSMAIIRRLRTQGPIGRPSIGLPRSGMAVPQFSMASTVGDEISTNWIEKQPSVLVGFFAASCPACSRLKDTLRRTPPADPLVAFLRQPGEQEVVDLELHEVLAAFGPVISFDASSEITHKFHVEGFPTLIRFENGTVAAAAHTLRGLESKNGHRRGMVPRVAL